MSQEVQLLRHIDNPQTPHAERALLRCALARTLEDTGNYDDAFKSLGPHWQGVGERPWLDGLNDVSRAEVLLRAGTLSGWIGSMRQITGAQEKARHLIGESAAIFDSLRLYEKVAEAQTELAYCYWREGFFKEARNALQQAQSKISDGNNELRAKNLLRSAIVEMAANRHSDAFYILTSAAHLFELINNHLLKGAFHNELAILFKNLGTAEKREDYIDRALVEYTAASFHFEQAGHVRYCAIVESNLGGLFFTLSRLAEANEHLDRSRRLFVDLNDNASVAQVDETRARILLAQGQFAEAERVIAGTVNILEKGGQRALLAENLATQGVALARLGNTRAAQATFERAISVAEEAGDQHGAGRTILSVIEELAHHMNWSELRNLYERADSLLLESQHAETLTRLRGCARHIITAKPSESGETRTAFVHSSSLAAEVVNYARRVALTDRPVLITGETGVGKEVLARLMHEMSGRPGAFVAVNCASLCDTIIESQLFGHRKGSFTDAVADHVGAARAAAGGTLFLDEVGDLSAANQAKLLRLIECGEIYSVGSPLPEYIDLRIIAATNRDLKQEVVKGNFRQDLYFRLSAFVVEIPPLRERPEDIPLLADHFIYEACKRYDKQVRFTQDALEAMRKLKLPGNARELRTLIERTFMLAPDGSEISARDVEIVTLRQTQNVGFANVWGGCSLEKEVRVFEGNLIRLALDVAQGHLTRAARLLGVTHQCLAYILNGRHKELLSSRKPIQRRRARTSKQAKRSNASKNSAD